jgi:hypothetical protein
MGNYSKLGKMEFELISKSTGYKVNYVRQIIRGYIKTNPRTEHIIHLADEILEKKEKMLDPNSQ